MILPPLIFLPGLPLIFSRTRLFSGSGAYLSAAHLSFSAGVPRFPAPPPYRRPAPISLFLTRPHPGFSHGRARSRAPWLARPSMLAQLAELPPALLVDRASSPACTCSSLAAAPCSPGFNLRPAHRSCALSVPSPRLPPARPLLDALRAVSAPSPWPPCSLRATRALLTAAPSRGLFHGRALSPAELHTSHGAQLLSSLSLALGFCFSCAPWSPPISRWPRCLRAAASSSSASSSISLRRYSAGRLRLPSQHAASSLLSSLAIVSSLPALSPAARFVSCSPWSASPPVPSSDRASSPVPHSSARCAPCSTVSIQCVVVDGYPLRVYPKIAACAGRPLCSTLSGRRTLTPLIFSSPLCRPPSVVPCCAPDVVLVVIGSGGRNRHAVRLAWPSNLLCSSRPNLLALVPLCARAPLSTASLSCSQSVLSGLLGIARRPGIMSIFVSAIVVKFLLWLPRLGVCARENRAMVEDKNEV
jgi:hypothetical protein